VENTASGRVAEKAGFTLEGRLRRSYRYGDGLKHDEFIWSRLAGDPAPDLSSRS
jgi:RimJ/RimL family protein N-acetyltransferase